MMMLMMLMLVEKRREKEEEEWRSGGVGEGVGGVWEVGGVLSWALSWGSRSLGMDDRTRQHRTLN
jgi:hypothetical protein